MPTAGGAGGQEPAGPDAAPPRAPGAPTEPFRQFVVKVAGRCDLACRYCYMYFAADTGWRGRPAAAPPDVLRQTARRIAEHAAAHGLPEISLVLHGGEPLLAGAGRLGEFVDLVRRLVPGGCVVHAGVQTNGTLLTEDRLRVLAAHRIRVALSVDGGLPEHNRLRVDHAGRPAWPRIHRGLRLLAAHPDSWAGLVCVVDPRTDPAGVYRSLLAWEPPSLAFLLPHGNWSRPPPGLPAGADRPAPYADWLCAVFDRWWDADRRRTRIRLFQECVALLLGAPAATESLGLAPFTAVVVNDDGAIEQSDVLRTAYDGAAATGLDVFRHSFDRVLEHPGVAARQSGLAALCGRCRACPVVRVCGGGHYAHRYREGHGFRNPSVYCPDLARFIGHVAGRLAEAAPA
ncbi:hypothetical protein GCM10009716_08610 [Streptomyces sodiiphilus]|uniref:Radical SAM core domain-containing protein n=1 Tax=Streptomyces sodiiphilus TaxID=226217 RepID=A0ABN2NUC2_9ACTN